MRRLQILHNWMVNRSALASGLSATEARVVVGRQLAHRPMRARVRNACRIVSLFGAAAISQVADAAQLQGFVWTCGENKQLCYWHKALVTAPKGWAEDEAWTKRLRAERLAAVTA